MSREIKDPEDAQFPEFDLSSPPPRAVGETGLEFPYHTRPAMPENTWRGGAGEGATVC